jgi:hypothetical protein
LVSTTAAYLEWRDVRGAGEQAVETAIQAASARPFMGGFHYVKAEKQQASEQSLTNIGFCWRVFLDGKRRVRLNQRGIGEYTAALPR